VIELIAGLRAVASMSPTRSWRCWPVAGASSAGHPSSPSVAAARWSTMHPSSAVRGQTWGR